MNHYQLLSLFLLFLALVNAEDTTTHAKRQAVAPTTTPSSCIWSDWGDFGACADNLMTRTKNCTCNGILATAAQCPVGVSSTETVGCLESNSVDTTSDIDDEPAFVCSWKWSKWTPCTQPCGDDPVGMTTRIQECWCVDMTLQQNDTMCESEGLQSTENVVCNDFDCDTQRPHNKLYWINRATTMTSSIYKPWPLSTNTTFKCSRGDEFHFSSIYWLAILEAAIYASNPVWHYLAKEYIPARLNLASGCVLGTDTFSALDDAQYLLAKCSNFSAGEITLAYATKEKLARFNNGIGGLSNVDVQMGLASAGGGNSGEEAGWENSTVILPLAITCIVLFGIVLLYSIYLLRVKQRQRQTAMVVENETFLSSSEDDEEEDNGKDDRSAEELRL